MKTFVLLCGTAAAGVADLLGDDFSTVTVQAPDASDVQMQLIAPLSFAIVAVGLGGETGGKQAEIIVEALHSQGVRVFLVATMPGRNDGCRRGDRARDQLMMLSDVAGRWVYDCDGMIKKYGECNILEMYEYYIKDMSAAILAAKEFNK